MYVLSCLIYGILRGLQRDLSLNKDCNKASQVNINKNTRKIMNKAIGGNTVVDYFEVGNNFCANAQLQHFLTEQNIHAHPCNEYREQRALQEYCYVFAVTATPPDEVRQFAVDFLIFFGLCIDVLFGGMQ